jgi:hypothetical protein
LYLFCEDKFQSCEISTLPAELLDEVFIEGRSMRLFYFFDIRDEVNLAALKVI